MISYDDIYRRICDIVVLLPGCVACRYCCVDMHDLHMCPIWQWWFMHIYVYIQYVHGLWIFNTFNHRSNYWTKTNTLVKCNRTILSTVQVFVTHTHIYIYYTSYLIMHPYYISRIVRLMFEHSQCSMFFVCFCNVVPLCAYYCTNRVQGCHLSSRCAGNIFATICDSCWVVPWKKSRGWSFCP